MLSFRCRKYDYENYLSTLLIKGPQERQCAFAVRAFNVEIAKIAGSVCERMTRENKMNVADHRLCRCRCHDLNAHVFFCLSFDFFVPDMFKVSEEKIAQLRLKFWYDALDKIYDKNRAKILPEHPVIQELNHVGCSNAFNFNPFIN